MTSEIQLYREKRDKRRYRDSADLSKGLIIKELAVFLIITFGIMLTFGWNAYSTDTMTGFKQLCYYMAAFSPAFGCIITRYLFREGFRDDILFPKFTGHFKGYLLSIVFPFIFGLMNAVLIAIVTGAGFSIKAENGLLEVMASIAFQSINGYAAFFILIGEELGWRAFLYDKLEKLLGLTGSVIVGGVIWGLWHIPPLIVAGLNFGKAAPGYPFTNIALMCVFCISLGAMLQLLRKLTDSVIAPIIAHALIDTVSNALASMFISQQIVEGKTFQIGLCILVSGAVLGLPCWIYMSRRYGHRRNKQE